MSIAVVGMACVLPDAQSPQELWETALAQRRAFRRIPSERLPLDAYGSGDRKDADRTYVAEAAVVTGFAFDRLRYRVGGAAYRSTDLTHWLALEVADRALADAGFPRGAGLPREATGVVLGNTLAGEFARAQALRLRWPYVRRVTAQLLESTELPETQRAAFLRDLESAYKAPFPPVGEDTLAGGLSNTIAGRICNHFDLHGGGYTVDGACASSLLAVSTACTSLEGGALDVAIAGGVDLSLDPFELVGFARLGALASGEMRIYDAEPTGFLPGEGCGVVVLMRAGDAEAQGRSVHALIRGWGISSDGHGGLTRPEPRGQALAIERAYRRAGFGPDSVPYFEGHGTGTAVGDTAELRALAQVRSRAGGTQPPAAIGSVKANIGHTKAAAGVAGLIKAVMALRQQLIPPTTGCSDPHPELAAGDRALRIVRSAEVWPRGLPLRAGVSAMGFGGINAHVVLEGGGTRRNRGLTRRERELLASAQDQELFLIAGEDRDALRRRIDRLVGYAAKLSYAELGDLSASLARAAGGGRLRAALVASSPGELDAGLRTLAQWLEDGEARRVDPQRGVFLGSRESAPAVGFLFPGHAAPVRVGGGALERRFEEARGVYARAGLPVEGDTTSTAVAQPAILTASAAALRVLQRFGVMARVGVGHSLGELAALHWAGALDERTLLELARARGRAMQERGRSDGAMAGITAGEAASAELVRGEPVVIAAVNSPRQTVVSGAADAIERILGRARAQGVAARRLSVPRAFHSEGVAACAEVFGAALAGVEIGRPRRRIVSTVSGTWLGPDPDLRDLLLRQITQPVRFWQAATRAGRGLDLWIEVGPGRVLSQLLADAGGPPVVSMDAGADGLAGTLRAVGAAFALGGPVDALALVRGRFQRPFDLDGRPVFFANPCEEAAEAAEAATAEARSERPVASGREHDGARPSSIPDLVRDRVAAETELPVSEVGDHERMLTDLHLSSIAVSEIVVDVARQLDLPPPLDLLDYADATVAEICTALAELQSSGGRGGRELLASAAGVDSWVRCFEVSWCEEPKSTLEVAVDPGRWRLADAAGGDTFARALLARLEETKPRHGLLVYLGAGADDAGGVARMLEAARAALRDPDPGCLLVVHHGAAAASIARTLHLEARHLTTCVVDVPAGHPDAVQWVVDEVGSATDYAEVRYTAAGRRGVRRLRLHRPGRAAASVPLSPSDVLLVTGGGKGIAAELALRLAQETGVRLALVGRSRPAADAELCRNLERMDALGVEYRYERADVCDAEGLGAALRAARSALGPITAFLHGAGNNEPKLLSSLTQDDFGAALAPKLDGARNVLSALDPDALRLFVALGSVIAEVGLPGEAHYAHANERLRRLVEEHAAAHAHCRCAALQWSVWSGVGMGERLGRVEALAAQGVTAIDPDAGYAALRDVLRSPGAPTSLVVTGRWRPSPTLETEPAELPLRRFVERPLQHVPGVELIVQATLSAQSDPYLLDHCFERRPLLPAVMGLEAMAQVAQALAGSDARVEFEEVAFSRPIAVAPDREVAVRIAALERAPGRIEVTVRCEDTGFATDHFRATCRFDRAEPRLGRREIPDAVRSDVLPERDLYGRLLFQGGRFRRVARYRELCSRGCVAELSGTPAAGWFGPYLPSALLLGDAGLRDAALHAVQACVPDATLLPTGVERIRRAARAPGDRCFVHARERVRRGDTFTYDLDLTDARGRVFEQWRGLRLQRVAEIPPDSVWCPALLAVALERRAAELLGCALRPVLEPGDDGLATERALSRGLGRRAAVLRRPDGRPESRGVAAVSSSHGGGFTLAVSADTACGCDCELVRERPEVQWRDLLGGGFAVAERLAGESGEDAAVSCTRVWSAREALRKAGAGRAAPLVHRLGEPGGWALLSSGRYGVLTFAGRVAGAERGLVLALAGRPD